MEALKEVTVWEGIDYRQPNHTYLMDGDKAVAYIKWHEGEPEFFKRPMKLDKRYRKFEKVDAAIFGQPKVESAVVEVQGSKGKTYYVNRDEKTCSCPGFTFRGACKHVAEIG